VPPAGAGTVTTPTSCTNTAQAGTTALAVTLTGALSPDPATVGEPAVLEGATFSIGVPPTVLLVGYSLGLLTLGSNTIPAEVNVTLLSAGAAEPSQASGPLSVTGTTVISDPTPANKTSGDESATPLTVTTTLPTTSWTPTGGPLSLRLGPSATTALVGPGGVIAVTFNCTPGTPTPAGCGPAPAAACTGTDPVAAAPFTQVEVGSSTSPQPPVCTDEAVDVAVGGSVTIDLSDNCSDPNGALDAATIATGAASAGSVSPGPTPGTVTYQAADTPGTASFTFTIADVGDPPAAPPVSNTATVTVNVLAPRPPVCTDETVQVVPGAVATIDLSDNCSDPDGDLDLTTLAVTGPIEPTGPGTFTYLAGDPGTIELHFTVADTTGLVSNEATVTIVSTSTPPSTSTTTSTTISTTPTTVGLTPVPVTGSARYVASCRNSVTPDLSEMAFDVTATTTSPVLAGSTAELRDQTWTVSVPASVLQTGMNLGLLHAGDTVTGVVTVSVFASNTSEGTVQAPPASIAVGPIATSPTGTALPATATFSVANLSWTPVGGDVAFSMAGASVAVSLGPVTVTFTCEPTLPLATIVTAAVRGSTGAPAADRVEVRGAVQEVLARTGSPVALPVSIAVALLDLGYLALTAAPRPRRRSR
jgi:hypothetical protein